MTFKKYTIVTSHQCFWKLIRLFWCKNCYLNKKNFCLFLSIPSVLGTNNSLCKISSYRETFYDTLTRQIHFKRQEKKGSFKKPKFVCQWVGTRLWNASVFPTVSMTCASRDFSIASHKELYYARCKAGRQIKSMMGLHNQVAIVS